LAAVQVGLLEVALSPDREAPTRADLHFSARVDASIKEKVALFLHRKSVLI
jgi:hypothetical protein